MTSPAQSASSTPPGLTLVGAGAVVPPPTVTPRLGLPKPHDDADYWGDDYRRAMDYLDAHPGIAIVEDGVRPSTPYDGQVILERASHRLLSYAAGTMQWTPAVSETPGPAGSVGPAGPAGPVGPAGQIITQTFVQSFASQTWLMPHSLSHRPNVLLFDNNGDEMFADLSYPNPTLVRVDFGFPMTGSAQMD